MGTASPPPADEETSSPGLAATVLGLATFVVLAVLIYVLVKAVDPGHVSPRGNPGFLDLMVGNRTVLTVLRLAILSIAVYAAYSCFELIRGRRPASRFWMVQADEAAEIAQHAGEEAVGQIRLLEEELAHAQRDNEFLIEYVQDLQAQLDTSDDAADTGV